MNPPDPYKAICITRNNIISVLRVSIKDLFERSCSQDFIDDYTDYAINLFTILEHIIYFCVNGTGLIFSQKMEQHPWKLFYNYCSLLDNTCISTITQLDNLADDFARVRAVLRIGLMEKRLHDYFSAAFNNKIINSKFYSAHSIILSGHLPNIINQLNCLSAVDFSFDLKLNLNHQGFYPIDYGVYLTLPLSPQSLLDDINECDPSHGSNGYCYWREKYELVFTKAKVDLEQKSYLEEMILNRDSKISALENRNELFSSEVKTLENSVTDLQIQLTLLHEQYSKEIEKLGGNSLSLNVPSVKSVFGSRADFLSSRHPLTNHFTQLDDSISSNITKDRLYSSPLPQLTPFYFSTSVQDCYSKLSKMAASTGDLRTKILSNSPSRDSLDKNQGQLIIGKQLITKATQRFYSPKSKTNHKLSTNSTVASGDIHNNNSDYSSRLLEMKCDEQRTRILESQQLRKIMGQACRSPMIRAHQRCAQYVNVPKYRTYKLTDSYSLDDMSTSFNYNNCNVEEFSPTDDNNVRHSPDEEDNYYHLSTVSGIFEQLSEDDFFGVDSSRVETLIHSDDGGAVVAVATVTRGVQVLPAPEIVRQPALVTAEVPETVEPLAQGAPRQSSTDNYHNGDRR